jgi:hypothetical protein
LVLVRGRSQGALALLATLGCVVKPLRGNKFCHQFFKAELGTTEIAKWSGGWAVSICNLHFAIINLQFFFNAKMTPNLGAGFDRHGVTSQ